MTTLLYLKFAFVNDKIKVITSDYNVCKLKNKVFLHCVGHDDFYDDISDYYDVYNNIKKIILHETKVISKTKFLNLLKNKLIFVDNMKNCRHISQCIDLFRNNDKVFFNQENDRQLSGQCTYKNKNNIVIFSIGRNKINIDISRQIETEKCYACGVSFRDNETTDFVYHEIELVDGIKTNVVLPYGCTMKNIISFDEICL